MICEQIVNLIRKICCCDAIIIKREKHQKMKIKRNIQKNFKEYSPVSISENENEKIDKSCYIPTYVYIILSFILLCFIIYFIIKIYEIIISINRVTDINNQNNQIQIKEEKNINNTKVCLCTLAKNENRYIREYVQHYEKYGVDKIFLYDNNDVEGEKFDDILSDYIQNGFVEVRNWRGKAKALMPIMNDCYQTNYKIYDWLIFYEIDEYIHLNHLLSTSLRNCNGYGNKNRYYYNTYSNQNDYKHYYIDHYYSKSTEEFIDKINKGDPYIDTLKYIMQKVDKYFSQSEITREKIDYIENKTGLNLSLYRSKAKK